MSESTVLVSVLMPAYNCERFIAQAIQSVLDQTYSNFELLIADDASTDKTKSQIESFNDKRITVDVNLVNKGYVQTTNALFRKSKGELITFMDADDWSDPGRLELLVKEFAKDSTLGCAGSFAKRVNENGEIYSDIKFETEYEKIKNDLPLSFNFIGAAIMIRREVLNEVGVYEEQFSRIGSEHLYWGGKIILKYKTINVPEFLYYYRHLNNSFSSNNARSVKGQLSKELAQIGIKELAENNRDIFKKNNSSYYKEVMNYLMMKYNFWNDNFLAGSLYYLKTWAGGRTKFQDRNQLMGMYFKKWLKKYFLFFGKHGNEKVTT